MSGNGGGGGGAEACAEVGYLGEGGVGFGEAVEVAQAHDDPAGTEGACPVQGLSAEGGSFEWVAGGHDQAGVLELVASATAAVRPGGDGTGQPVAGLGDVLGRACLAPTARCR